MNTFHTIPLSLSFAFFENNGLELIKLQEVSIQGGSLIGTAQITNGPYLRSHSVDQFISQEDDRLLDHPDTLKTFAAKLRDLRQQVNELSFGWQNKETTIAGFGAARSGNTLIAQMGLHELIDFIVDDHPQKVNKRIGGYDIPVYPTTELAKRKPNYTFILAWIHAKRSLRVIKNILNQGEIYCLLSRALCY